MNIAEARKVLSGPLLFGDESQVKASNLVAAWEEASELLERFEGWLCEKCDGEGMVDCECLDCGHVHDRKCPECRGKGVEIPDIDHMGIESLATAIMQMAQAVAE